MHPLRLLAALALTLTATLGGAASATAAPVPAGLTVNLLDLDGKPVVGVIQLLGPDGFAIASAAGVTSKAFDLEPGTYGVMTVTAWGGLQCSAMTACDYLSLSTGQAKPDGSLVVAPGKPVSVTVQTTEEPARISGKRLVGSELSIDFADGLDELYTALGAGGIGMRPGVTWLRDGAPIPGATDPTYVPTGADTGKAIAARLMYSGVGMSYMQQVIGVVTVPPITTAAVSVAKKSAQTFIRMVRSQITSKQRGVVRVDVTSPNAIVTGKVKVSVGDWSDTRPLRNGRVAFQLPALGAGKYVVHASYLGSGDYKPSSAKPKTLTVSD